MRCSSDHVRRDMTASVSLQFGALRMPLYGVVERRTDAIGRLARFGVPPGKSGIIVSARGVNRFNPREQLHMIHGDV